MNTLQPYIIITTYPYIYLYIQQIPQDHCNSQCLSPLDLAMHLKLGWNNSQKLDQYYK